MIALRDGGWNEKRGSCRGDSRIWDSWRIIFTRLPRLFPSRSEEGGRWTYNVLMAANPLDGYLIGVGTWAWGDKMMWGYGQGFYEQDLRDAYQTAISAGVRVFDTAETYGQGASERILGQFIREDSDRPFIASKFMPYPWRLSPKTLIKSLKASLARLKLDCLDLYQMHWPLPPLRVETWMEAMADAVQAGLIRNVGVSNYDAAQTRAAYERLQREGIRLVSNQVEYNLVNRKIERNGVKRVCEELGVRVIAYSPLAMGALTGKYTSDNPPSGGRGFLYNRRRLAKLNPLLRALRRIGEAHDGKTPSQVAINWTICKGALPIPGAKNGLQAQQNSDSATWRLSEGEVAELDDISGKLTE